jgi:DNA helicase IV
MEKKQPEFKLPKKWDEKAKEWKAAHGKVKFLNLDSEIVEGEKSNEQKITLGKLVFFRQPSRQEMSAAEGVSVNEDGKSDLYRKADQIMADCYLGGDLSLEEIAKDIEVYMAVAQYCLYNLVQVKNVNWGSC